MTQFTQESLSYCWFSEVYCIAEHFFVAQVRRTVPARQDKGDGHRSKHFRDRRDTFAGEIHVKNRRVMSFGEFFELVRRHPQADGQCPLRVEVDEQHATADLSQREIGRASCRERVSIDV